MATVILFGFMLIIMLMRVALPFGTKAEGGLVKEIRLSFWERLLFHRVSIYAIGLVLLITALSGLLSRPLELVVVLAVFAVLLVPVRYIMTTQGVGLNNVVFRPWADFTGVEATRRRLRLIARSGLRPFDLHLLGNRQEETLGALRRFIKFANRRPKGEARGEKIPLEHVSKLRASSSPGSRARPLRRLSGRHLALLVLPLVLIALTIGSGVAAADGPDDPPKADQSGLTTGTGADLVGIAPGTITEDDYNAAVQSEPFAAKLADLVNQNRLGINFMWVLITGYLVMFMQAGFALVETGFCRAKNAMHVMLMNFMIYGLGMLGYFVAGFALQFGGIGRIGVPNLGGLGVLDKEWTVHVAGTDWGIAGHEGFFLAGSGYDVAVAVMFLFQMVFMDTAATIPTGAMAERWKWTAFVIYGFFISTIIYPIYGNWAWGGGWLSQLGAAHLGKGYLDFAGSGVVHAIGGWTGLAGAMVLGARLGKYNPDGSSNAIPGHNIILASLGTFILAFGWFGFNPGSTLGASGLGNLRIGIVAASTMLASAAGAFTAMMYTWTVSKKPDPGMALNGMLAGLVAITAPSGYVSPYMAVLIGGVAGVLVVLSVAFLDRVLHVDDPVGAISVHGTCGAWGQLSLGLFADGTMNYNGLTAKGLLFGDAGQFGAQVIGTVVAFVWAFGVSWLFFKAVDRIIGMRVSPETELAGLDVPELGLPGYSADAEPYRAPTPLPGSVTA